MKRFERLFVLIMALAVSGWLAYKFVSDFEPVNMIAFAVVILIGSEICCQIDKRIPCIKF